MRPEIVEACNAAAAGDGVAPWPPTWNGDLDVLFDEWVDWGTPMEHLASWWPLRHEPFVLLVHYADLLADLEGEMRRIAGFLGIDVPSDRWPGAVDRCRFESMRDQHGSGSVLESAFEGGESAFFTAGRVDVGVRSSPRSSSLDTTHSSPSSYRPTQRRGSSMDRWRSGVAPTRPINAEPDDAWAMHRAACGQTPKRSCRRRVPRRLEARRPGSVEVSTASARVAGARLLQSAG
jgi:hypothetical protein